MIIPVPDFKIINFGITVIFQKKFSMHSQQMNKRWSFFFKWKDSKNGYVMVNKQHVTHCSIKIKQKSSLVIFHWWQLKHYKEKKKLVCKLIYNTGTIHITTVSYFSKERNRMSISLVKAELQVLTNFDFTCKNFYDFVMKNRQILDAARKQNKYKFKN